MKHVIATLNELELNVGKKKRERKKDTKKNCDKSHINNRNLKNIYNNNEYLLYIKYIIQLCCMQTLSIYNSCGEYIII